MSSYPQEKSTTLHIFAIYHTELDRSLLADDLLCELRREFFTSSRRLKNKVVREQNGISYRYAYQLEKGAPLKWKKLEGYRQVEKSFFEPDGGYVVVTQDTEKRVVKNVFYDAYHAWKKSEYFSSSVQSGPAVILEPSGDIDGVVVLRERNEKGERAIELLPCEIPQNPMDLSRLNQMTGTPQYLCRTDKGDFYYCDAETAKKRIQALEKLRKNEENRPLFVPNREEEPITEEPADREHGFQIVPPQTEAPAEAIEAANPAISSEPVSYQWGSSTDLQDNDEPVFRQPLPARPLMPLEEEAQRDGIEKAMENNPAQPHATETPRKEYEYSSIEPADTKETPAKDLTDMSAAEETPADKPRRYNVYVQPISKNTYTGFTPPSLKQEAGEEAERDPSHSRVQAYVDAMTPFSSEDLPYTLESLCDGAQSGCPHRRQNKMVIAVSEQERYTYFGDILNGKRHGVGRTAMENGKTAYEGGYLSDKRDGFGVYYYKTGRLCYAGNWKQNQRDGMGVSFRPKDKTVHVGCFTEDEPVGMGARFDDKGNLLFAGRYEDGKRQGGGVSYCAADGRIVVGQWEGDVPTGKGTEFDENGNLLYSGGWKDGERSGLGMCFDETGALLYKGDFYHNRYHGEGTLYLADGHIVTGLFQNGEIGPGAAEYDSKGVKIYQGDWKHNRYHGDGCKYLSNGSRYQGTFNNGEPDGKLRGYDPKGDLVYHGEFSGDCYHGEGVAYLNGQKIYEGSFEYNQYSGRGYEFANGNCIYSGAFLKNQRDGFGASYENGSLSYLGEWKLGKRHGAGIYYRDGKICLVGGFCDGQPHGRVNVVSEGRLVSECIFEQGKMIYLREFDESGCLKREGNVQNGALCGMGCTLSPYGEKQEEGIFLNDKLIKRMKVILDKLDALPKCPDSMKNTEYLNFLPAPDYAVEQPVQNGIYTGQMKEGVPHGKGTMLYKDHRYTGAFESGKACGVGVIYQNDGTRLVGEFTSQAGDRTISLMFADGVSYYYVNSQSDAFPDEETKQ